MHKCDRDFFARDIARIDAARAAPAPKPTPHVTALTDAQRAVFLQQLCFLRIYDRVVDRVFADLEAAHARVCGPSVFEQVREAKRRLAVAQTLPALSPMPPPLHPHPIHQLPLPDAFASPMSAPTASPTPPAAMRPRSGPVLVQVATLPPLAIPTSPPVGIGPLQAGGRSVLSPHSPVARTLYGTLNQQPSPPYVQKVPLSAPSPPDLTTIPGGHVGGQIQAVSLGMAGYAGVTQRPSMPHVLGASSLAQERVITPTSSTGREGISSSQAAGTRDGRTAPASSKPPSTMSISSVINN